MNALQNTEIFLTVVLLNNVEAPGVWEVGVHVHDEVVEVLEFFLGSAVV